jgi:GNAT superfamily N-acetyltransferase
MIVREITSTADRESWTRVRNRVEVEAPSTLDDLLLVLRHKPETRHWLAEDGGEAVGCVFASRGSVPGRVFVLPRVVPEARGRGVGAALLAAALPYVRTLGPELTRSHVDGDDAHSLGFAHRRGCAEVDRQVELVRDLGPDEEPPAAIAGIELAEHRDDPEPFRPLVAAGVADMPVFGGIGDVYVDELIDELRKAVHVVTAREGGVVVGLAGLAAYGAGREDALEHAFTTVSPTHRGRGIAKALKQACVHWSSAQGYRQLVTWTQDGNEAMQAVNEGVGFRPGKISITVEGPLA